jgi:NAD(P)-dependent dehydrogenase (short-subunit alcohol dehydrogenase family)
MKTIVITGSTRGIGYGLAETFLALDCAVTISGRTTESVERAVAALSTTHDADRIFGQPCDVTRFEQVQALWAAAQTHFGRIDIWINNAGVANPPLDFLELSPEQIRAVVETNLIGTMNGSKVALNGMLAQGFGTLYNMEGLGSDGRQVEGLSLYGSTKRALRYLDEALIRECQGTPVLVGSLSPGMVVTDMLTAPYNRQSAEWARVKRIFNILADRVETVTPWLAEQVLANQTHGTRIAWLTRRRMFSRFLLAPFRKRDLFETKADRDEAV